MKSRVKPPREKKVKKNNNYPRNKSKPCKNRNIVKFTTKKLKRENELSTA